MTSFLPSFLTFYDFIVPQERNLFSQVQHVEDITYNIYIQYFNIFSCKSSSFCFVQSCNNMFLKTALLHLRVLYRFPGGKNDEVVV